MACVPDTRSGTTLARVCVTLTPMKLEATREIAAPPEIVWQIVTNIANSSNVISGIESVEVLEGLDFGVGTRWRETRIMFGRAATEEMTVTAVDPGRSYTTEAGNRGAQYLSVLTVERVSEVASRLTMTFSAEATTLPSRILTATIGKLLIGATRKALEADLADLASAAEATKR